MATKTMTLKLLIDTKENKVVVAKASKDFVDFLLSLFSLPLCDVIKLLAHESAVASMGNLYATLANFDDNYLRPTSPCNHPLSRMLSNNVYLIPLIITGSSTGSQKFYTCRNLYCNRCFTDKYNGAVCPVCSEGMNYEITYVAPSNTSATAASSNVDKDAYMISDDLRVQTTSTKMHLLNFAGECLSKLQEVEVKVGIEEEVELLKTAFLSTTVLTDVFLKKGKRAT